MSDIPKPPEGYEETEYVPQQVELMYAVVGYAAWQRDNGYEILADVNGRIVAHITEPEDRNFHRDLRPIVTELSALRAEIAAAREYILDLRHVMDAMRNQVPISIRCRVEQSRIAYEAAREANK